MNRVIGTTGMATEDEIDDWDDHDDWYELDG